MTRAHTQSGPAQGDGRDAEGGDGSTDAGDVAHGAYGDLQGHTRPAQTHALNFCQNHTTADACQAMYTLPTPTLRVSLDVNIFTCNVRAGPDTVLFRSQTPNLQS